MFFLAQAFAKRAIARGGGAKIINVASVLAYTGGIRVPSYTASKHGVAGLTKLLANEWAAKGINVNAIAPGYVRTDATQALQDDPARSEKLLSRIPAARWGEPEDMGGAAVFLASRASDYCHGTILVVDGGWLAGHQRRVRQGDPYGHSKALRKKTGTPRRSPDARCPAAPWCGRCRA